MATTVVTIKDLNGALAAGLMEWLVANRPSEAENLDHTLLVNHRNREQAGRLGFRVPIQFEPKVAFHDGMEDDLLEFRLRYGEFLA